MPAWQYAQCNGQCRYLLTFAVVIIITVVAVESSRCFAPPFRFFLFRLSGRNGHSTNNIAAAAAAHSSLLRFKSLSRNNLNSTITSLRVPFNSPFICLHCSEQHPGLPAIHHPVLDARIGPCGLVVRTASPSWPERGRGPQVLAASCRHGFQVSTRSAWLTRRSDASMRLPLGSMLIELAALASEPHCAPSGMP
jgi:hypothetical protein